ncbi:hypothetical protein ACFYYB_09450 [Streptomyces sp. NPDC002886]|uniref:hypothetical protein n=1 Tax=Streptomyces sp. NPDC002886 TaxID=3364667 RepID=UPI00367707E5
MFWILGGMGIAWALVWVKVIRNRPEQHLKVGEYELVHITEDEATTRADRPEPCPSSPPSWACCAAAVGPTGRVERIEA